AVVLYKGDFLEGFYDDWCLEERYRLEGLYLEALERLVAAHETLAQPEDALRYAGLLLARDPLREDVHRTVIRLHVRLGNRAEAVRQARWCRAVLRTELGIEPQSETVALCDELLGPAWRREPGEKAPVQRGPPPRSLPSFVLESPPFVGRKTEWESLLAHWERAKPGQGHLVLVSGEAGIGKSRLVEELSQYVRQRGGWTACGRCYEYEHALPHGPLADLLRAVLAAMGVCVLDRLPPWQAAELARLAPEVGERSPSPPFIPPQVGGGEEGGADQQQARLFDALTLLLLDLTQRNPLLLMLEDLHWAQDSTLAWLHYLARHLPQAHILLVATYRREEVGPAHTLHGLALQLERSGLAARLELTCLPQEALGHWIAGASDALVARVYRQTEGNPFFTLETLRALLEEGQVQFVEGRWVEKTALSSLPIPTSVRQVIQARLERLSPSVREAVATAAVIGRAFDFDVLEQAWGQGEEATLEALDELLRRRLVRESSGPSSRDYEFDHHLVQEVIYRGLHYRRRRRLHRLAGEAMERLYAGQPGMAGELAHH
ncbi:MAG: AAA family ATPase, partial [Anaerolineae bacterium]|nr:AAA family ATPase [Anaerolineae bacterium]